MNAGVFMGQKKSNKKLYKKPSIKEFGNVADLTGGTAGTGQDVGTTRPEIAITAMGITVTTTGHGITTGHGFGA